MITIYSMAFNEELLIKFFIDHYRKRFPNCNIIIYDNESTDKTKKIALKNRCQVIDYKSNNQINDSKLRELKNNCWKSAKTEWVLVCDVDELLDITEQDLIQEQQNKISIIKSEGWNMVNMEDNYDLINIKYAHRDTQYDKPLLFNKSLIKEINYCYGAHSCTATGVVRYSNSVYKLYHYRFINPDYSIIRYKMTANRLSDWNKRTGCGSYYTSSEEEIRNDFNGRRVAAQKIL
jgi:hypothetical protein